jgi:hypothetical protein
MSCVESSALERGARGVRPPSERVGDCAWTDEASTRSEARSTAVCIAKGPDTAKDATSAPQARGGETELARAVGGGAGPLDVASGNAGAGRGAGAKLQRDMTAQLEQGRRDELHRDMMRLPRGDERRVAWLAVDCLSSQWVSSHPTHRVELNAAEFGEIFTTYMGCESRLVRPYTGRSIPCGTRRHKAPVEAVLQRMAGAGGRRPSVEEAREVARRARAAGERAPPPPRTATSRVLNHGFTHYRTRDAATALLREAYSEYPAMLTYAEVRVYGTSSRASLRPRGWYGRGKSLRRIVRPLSPHILLYPGEHARGGASHHEAA